MTQPRPPKRAGGISIGHLFGVEIVADWSLGIIFAIVTLNLGMAVFPDWHPEWSPALVWGVAVGASLSFFASLLAHELSHALVGRVFGISVRRITLFIFGGVAEMDEEPPSPRSELWMAAAGPALSLSLGVAALFGASLLGDLSDVAADNPTEAISNLGPLATVLIWIGPVNLMLGVFNLVPGFPLDGGRVLRAFLWATTGDRTKATRWASLSGRAIAALLMAFGVTQLLGGQAFQGLWLLLIGWFLMKAAKGGYEQTLIARALENVGVTDVMRAHPDTVGPTLSVAALVSDHIMATEGRAFPVVTQEGRLVGLVTLTDVKLVARDEWPRTAVQAIMTPLADLATLPVTATATEALQTLGKRELNQLPVVDGPVEDGALAGLVRREDIVRWLSLQDLTRDGSAR